MSCLPDERRERERSAPPLPPVFVSLRSRAVARADFMSFPRPFCRACLKTLNLRLMEFDLPLGEDRIKPHQVTALHLLSAFAFVGCGAIIMIYNYTIPKWGGVVFALGLAILIAVFLKNRWLIQTHINRVFRVVELASALSVLGLSLAMGWKFPQVIFGGLSAALVAGLFWESAAGTSLHILLSSEGIKLPVTSRTRNIQWPEVDSVVVKYGIVTINCVDDRLFQWSIRDVQADFTELVAFCERMVEENKAKRIVDDW